MRQQKHWLPLQWRRHPPKSRWSCWPDGRCLLSSFGSALANGRWSMRRKTLSSVTKRFLRPGLFLATQRQCADPDEMYSNVGVNRRGMSLKRAWGWGCPGGLPRGPNSIRLRIVCVVKRSERDIKWEIEDRTKKKHRNYSNGFRSLLRCWNMVVNVS